MWIVLTLAAVVLWSFVNISDNYLVQRNKKHGSTIGSLIIFSSVFAIIVSGIIYVFSNATFTLSFTSIFLLIVAGFCNLLWVVFYLKALSTEDVSSVVPWFLSVPLFGYILGYIILGETLSTHHFIGGGIILLGGIVLSVQKTEVEHHVSYRIKKKLILYMLIASFLAALWGILFKFVARDQGYWVSTFWEHIGLFVAGILVLCFVKSYRKGFVSMLRTGGKKILLVNCFSEISTILGNLLANYALLLVPVTFVFLLQVAQPVVVFLLGIVCTMYFPKILTEDISKKNILHKSISIGIMILGAIVLML